MIILIDARPLIDPLNGGVTRVAEGLIPALIRAMPEAEFVLGTTGMKKKVTGDRLQVTGKWKHLSIPNKLFSAMTVSGVTSFDRMLDKKADLLFLPNIGFIGRPRIPYALVLHDLAFLIEPRWFRFKARWWHKAVNAERLIREATWLFAVSERTKQDAIDLLGIDPTRIVVIPLGLPKLLAYSPTRLLASPYLLALGANDPRKNIGCAIEAVRLLRQDPRFSNVSLVCTDASATRPLAYDDDSVGIPNSLRGSPTRLLFPLRRPTNAALASLMQNAACFLYPSWYEGYGLPLHEAARFNTPCIASTAGALPETAPTGTLFAPPSKPHLWTLAMKMVLGNPTAHHTDTTLGSWDQAAGIIKQKFPV